MMARMLTVISWTARVIAVLFWLVALHGSLLASPDLHVDVLLLLCALLFLSIALMPSGVLFNHRLFYRLALGASLIQSALFAGCVLKSCSWPWWAVLALPIPMFVVGALPIALATADILARRGRAFGYTKAGKAGSKIKRLVVWLLFALWVGSLVWVRVRY